MVPVKKSGNTSYVETDAASSTHVILERLSFKEDYGARDANNLGVFVDTETTGLDPATDEIIQCTACEFMFNDRGEIGKVFRPVTWFNEPKRIQVNSTVTDLTGITNQMLVGQTLPPEELASLLAKARIIVAHNAPFDRRMIESHCRNYLNPRSVWLCTMRDVPWSRYDFKTTKLEYLAFKLGFVYDAHMSEPDVVAGIRVLATDLGGETVLRRAFSGLVSKRAVYANGSPFGKKDMLKKYGYQWDTSQRVWWKEVNETDAANEIDWLNNEIGGSPTSVHVPIWERHR